MKLRHYLLHLMTWIGIWELLLRFVFTGEGYDVLTVIILLLMPLVTLFIHGLIRKRTLMSNQLIQLENAIERAKANYKILLSLHNNSLIGLKVDEKEKDLLGQVQYINDLIKNYNSIISSFPYSVYFSNKDSKAYFVGGDSY